MDVKGKVFLISPVRDITAKQRREIELTVQHAEGNGWDVYWPERDTPQDDDCGLRICQDNREAILNSDQVWVYWDENSRGSLFDLGMAFAYGKPIYWVADCPRRTPHKSFANVILALSGEWL